MFFLLQKRVPGKPKNYWNQLGVVVAESANDAIVKIGFKETDRHQDELGIAVFLDDGKGGEYLLESIEEITAMPE